MRVVPGDVDTDGGPPMAIPLRHFLVALGLLVAGGAAMLASATGLLAGRAERTPCSRGTRSPPSRC
jgi:hypothetical protein